MIILVLLLFVVQVMYSFIIGTMNWLGGVLFFWMGEGVLSARRGKGCRQQRAERKGAA